MNTQISPVPSMPPIPVTLPFDIAPWDFCLFTGFLIVILLAILKRPKDFPVSRVGIFFCFLLMLYTGLLGAKLLFIILHWPALIAAESTITGIFDSAGYAYFGTIVFEMLTLVLFTKLRAHRISFLFFADYIAPFLVLHMAFVRIGCFLTGCCCGKITDLPWGVHFSRMDSTAVVLRHPTQLYEHAFLLVIFFAMRYLYKRPHRTGYIFLSSFGLYGFFRFFVEFLRIDSVPLVSVFTVANISTMSLAVLCFGCMIYLKFTGRK
ncbi:MAG: prolipoprotein diacylglyceryl transferase [Candidatus Omnitrophica bacterium]|nr:prolipoprotein diacylglyceryl transferase [Candidatus Omnitrophota bacterium]